jgi:hypothetical protein
MKSIFKRLEIFLKESAEPLPVIRYFDGKGKFSALAGEFQADTIEESLDLFLKSRGK